MGVFSYNKLRQQIVRAGSTTKALAEELGFSRQNFYARLKRTQPFSTQELARMARFLGTHEDQFFD